MTPDAVRELFERALQARKDLDHLRARLARLEAPPLSSGLAQVVQGSLSDPTANAASALVDGEAEMREIEAAKLAEIDQARKIIRGVRLGLGLIYGDILEDYYIRGLTWSSVARINGVGGGVVFRRRDVAFDWVASVGITHATRGEWGPSHKDPRAGGGVLRYSGGEYEAAPGSI